MKRLQNSLDGNGNSLVINKKLRTVDDWTNLTITRHIIDVR